MLFACGAAARYYDSCRMLVVEGQVSATLTALCAAFWLKALLALKVGFKTLHLHRVFVCVLVAYQG